MCAQHAQIVKMCEYSFEFYLQGGICREVSSTNSVNAMKVFVLILASYFDRVCVHQVEVQFWVKLNCLAQATNGICVGA